jgi:hypothetical protein
MDEKPKSIWKKPLTGPLAFLLFIPLLFAAILAIGWLADAESRLTMTFAGIGILVSLVIVLGVSFIRWVCCWRNFKRFLFGLACFITLVALFYMEEDWRGKHDWEKFKREGEAKGEHFDFKDFVPPPVPDDQNFAMAPIWVESIKATLGPERARLWYGDKFPDHDRTNFTERLLLEIWHDREKLEEPSPGDWQKAELTDLKAWQAGYRATNRTTDPRFFTNDFPVAPQPQSPAQDVLLALSKHDAAIEELRQASQLPYSRFPIEYDKDDPAEILLPHLAALKRGSQLLQLRAIAELQDGQTEKSFADIKLSLRLADSIRTEPFIITHLVRMAILKITLQPVWEGLAEHKWSDGQLAELDLELSKLDFLADYEHSIRGEPAAHIKLMDYLEQKRSRIRNFLNLISYDDYMRNVMNRFGEMTKIYLMPKGWFYQNEIVLAQMNQKWNVPMADDANQTVSPKTVLAGDAAELNLRPARFNFFARLLLPSLGSYVKKAAYAQTSANLARVAIALERYRLAHGECPGSLDVLAPQFMEKIPHDVIGGQPLKYRREGDGQFVLYSVGWNETDDGGVVSTNAAGVTDGKSESPTRDISQGDWVWRYPPK